MKLLEETIDLIFLSLTKTARILNIRAKKLCFLLYIAVDFYWLYIDLVRELYSQALFAVIAMFMHAYGYWYWSKNNIGAHTAKNKYSNPSENSDNEARGLNAPAKLV
jgi:nicotinamide riboside transporter PnuC